MPVKLAMFGGDFFTLRHCSYLHQFSSLLELANATRALLSNIKAPMLQPECAAASTRDSQHEGPLCY